MYEEEEEEEEDGCCSSQFMERNESFWKLKFGGLIVIDNEQQ